MTKRLERLGLSPEEFWRIHEKDRGERATPEVLARYRCGSTADVPRVIAQPKRRPPVADSVIRSYFQVQAGRVTSVFVLSKGLFTLRLAEHKAIADKMRERASKDLFFAKERTLARAGRRLQRRRFPAAPCALMHR